jgi:aspartate/methionine/tyrosine aminotransferase
MEIKHFAIEEWMNAYEHEAVYNMAETCVDSLTVKELITLGGTDPEQFFQGLYDKKLTYGHIEGSPELRHLIASRYKTVKPENVLIMNGAIGANFLVLYSLVQPGDEVICVQPTYQQLASVPESFGATLIPLELKEENGYLPDLEELKSLTTSKTKLIIINNPNNPTGALMKEEDLKEIVDIAKSYDAYLLCDEVYRGLYQDPNIVIPSAVDLYDKAISTGSMSKALSLAGLRLGWIAGPEEVIKECIKHRDYTTISCGMIDDLLATHALKNIDKIMERNLNIIRQNAQILDDWVKKEPRITYFKPEAGTTAMLKYDFDMPSEKFCLDLFKKNGAFLSPGSCFDMEGTVRIGYACDTEVLVQGLEKVSEYISELNVSEKGKAIPSK